MVSRSCYEEEADRMGVEAAMSSHCLEYEATEVGAEGCRMGRRCSRCLAIVLCCREAGPGEEEARWEVARLVGPAVTLRRPARWGIGEVEGGCWSLCCSSCLSPRAATWEEAGEEPGRASRGLPLTPGAAHTCCRCCLRSRTSSGTGPEWSESSSEEATQAEGGSWPDVSEAAAVGQAGTERQRLRGSGGREVVVLKEGMRRRGS